MSRLPQFPNPCRRPRLRHLAVFAVLTLVLGACASGSDAASDTEISTGEDSSTTQTQSDADEQAGSPDTPAGVDTDDAAQGGSDGDGESSDTGSNDGASSADGSSDDGQDATTSDEEPSMAASSPIGAFFADDGGFQAALEEYTARVEEEILRCMAAQGFEFIPSGRRVNDVERQQNELSEREWTVEYGYGISTSFDTIAQQRANDPNAEIVFSMSPGEREIWLETIFGAGYDNPTDLDLGARPLEEQGCIGQAIIATGGQGAIEGLEEFGDAYEEGADGIFDRNEMIIAVGDWSRCMGEAGYGELSELEDPEDSIRERLDIITAPLNAALDDLDPEEGRALIEGDTLELEALPGLDVDALRELQAEELAVAVTDLDCYDIHVRAIYEPLRDELERGLMGEYSAELDALKNIGS